MLTIQPKDDAFCTVKRKTKSNKKRSARTANAKSYIGCKEIKDRKDN